MFEFVLHSTCNKYNNSKWPIIIYTVKYTIHQIFPFFVRDKILPVFPLTNYAKLKAVARQDWLTSAPCQRPCLAIVSRHTRRINYSAQTWHHSGNMKKRDKIDFTTRRILLIEKHNWVWLVLLEKTRVDFVAVSFFPLIWLLQTSCQNQNHPRFSDIFLKLIWILKDFQILYIAL